VVAHDRLHSRSHALFLLLFAAGCAICLLMIPVAPHLLLGPAARFLDLAPIWRAVYLPILALTLASGVMSFLDVVRPGWTPARSVGRLAHHALMLLVAVVLFRAGEVVIARPDAFLGDGTSPAGVLAAVNAAARIGLLTSIVAGTIAIIGEVRRLRLGSTTGLAGTTEPRG
jgi:hypothetical protein